MPRETPAKHCGPVFAFNTAPHSALQLCGLPANRPERPLFVAANRLAFVTPLKKIRPMEKNSIHGMWSSRLMFILAAAGSAVGLGNIWRFPYLASDNGGGAFVLVYLGCIAAVGLPILIAEVLIG